MEEKTKRILIRIIKYSFTLGMFADIMVRGKGMISLETCLNIFCICLIGRNFFDILLNKYVSYRNKIEIQNRIYSITIVEAIGASIITTGYLLSKTGEYAISPAFCVWVLIISVIQTFWIVLSSNTESDKIVEK